MSDDRPTSSGLERACQWWLGRENIGNSLPPSCTLLCRVRGRRRSLPVAGNDRLLLVSHGGGSLCFSRRRCCGSRTSIWAVLGDWLIQYPERERLRSSRGAKTGLLFGQIKVPSLGQVEVRLHELQVLLLLPSLPRAAILLLAH